MSATASSWLLGLYCIEFENISAQGGAPGTCSTRPGSAPVSSNDWTQAHVTQCDVCVWFRFFFFEHRHNNIYTEGMSDFLRWTL